MTALVADSDLSFLMLQSLPTVARAFVKDMRAYFAEESRYKRDEIALRQLHALSQHQRPRERQLRLSDVKR
jgi:hypothetical protein